MTNKERAREWGIRMNDELKEAVRECRSAIEWAENGEDDQMAKDDALFPALRLVLGALEEAQVDRNIAIRKLRDTANQGADTGKEGGG